jgi:hypothetical protein
MRNHPQLECNLCKYYGRNDCRRIKPHSLAGSHIKQDGRNVGLNDNSYPIVKPDQWCGFFELGVVISPKNEGDKPRFDRK